MKATANAVIRIRIPVIQVIPFDLGEEKKIPRAICIKISKKKKEPPFM